MLHVLQGKGIHYDAAGNEYQGMWVRGVREGDGQQAYCNDESGLNDVYEGAWVQDNRCAHLLQFASLFYHKWC